ncbi:MAG TPA: aldo/keto reductase [Acidimicrobiales bacterium]|nr:aldo/keto reductase [Acidimicrobiales bacterium]
MDTAGPHPMPTSTLPGIARTVSVLGLGTAALGRPGYLNLGHGLDVDGVRDPAGLERRLHEVLDTAVTAGVTYVDTARSYGRGEEFVARWLQRRPATGAITVGSKWGYRYVADWQVDVDVHEVKDHSLGHLDHQWAETRTWLGDRVDLYQIHSATLDSGVLTDDAVLDRLAELRHDGVAIGLTTSGPGQADTIRAALEVRRGGDRLFDTVQATWNLLEPSAGPALAEAADAGLGVIVKEAVANGRLTARVPALAARLTDGVRHSADAVAIAAVLAQPWASVVLSGAATADQLVSNLGALDAADVDIDRLTDLAETPDEYWHRRSTLRWT